MELNILYQIDLETVFNVILVRMDAHQNNRWLYLAPFWLYIFGLTLFELVP